MPQTPPTTSPDSFGAKATLDVGGKAYQIWRIRTDALTTGHDVARLPYSIKVLLENLLRHEDGQQVTADDIQAVAAWGRRPERHGAAGSETREIAFTPERVLMQDFTGVPAVVDLAAMRTALSALGGDPARINPLVPVELVIDHSVVPEHWGDARAFEDNVAIEYERNVERYQLLRWAQQSFEGFRVVPPGTGICHQVNLEYLSRVVFPTPDGRAYCDTLVGTDSHTTMVNGLGVLGWGVGGIEAEAAMLGQPLSMLLPPVVGLRLSGGLPEGATATDLVLTITQLLRRHGVVGKFVECFGPGVATIPVENRATIGNMSPEYGATCTIFPIDQATLDYLRFTGRPDDHVRPGRGLREGAGALARAGWRRARLLRDGRARPLDGRAVPGRPGAAPGPCAARRERAGVPRRPRPRTPPGPRSRPPAAARSATATWSSRPSRAAPTRRTPRCWSRPAWWPSRAVERGLTTKPWVKTSLAPGSRVVMDYLERAGLLEPLEKLGFYLVGFGCTTCIGNSGPLLPGVSEEIRDADLSVAAVLSGNRNFEGRIHPDVRMNYLASPPLVVAYAFAGTIDIDLATQPLGTGSDGSPVFLADLWPCHQEVSETVREALGSDMFRERYASVFEGDEHWRSMSGRHGPDLRLAGRLHLRAARRPSSPACPSTPDPVSDVHDARVLAVLGDSVTTDHISPAGSIGPTTPAGRYLTEHGVARGDFNSYGARRGNHEVMMRGTFANIRLRNRLAPGTEGGITVHLPDGEQMTIYEAAMRYAERGHAARGARRQGVRHRVEPRLGGQGHAAARGARRAGRELRAHPPLQPGRHGRPAARSSRPARSVESLGTDRRRGLHHRRPRGAQPRRACPRS